MNYHTTVLDIISPLKKNQYYYKLIKYKLNDMYNYSHKLNYNSVYANMENTINELYTLYIPHYMGTQNNHGTISLLIIKLIKKLKEVNNDDYNYLINKLDTLLELNEKIMKQNIGILVL